METSNPATHDHADVHVTCRSHEEARRIAGALVEERLAACVQIAQVESVFSWDGRIETETEFALTIKTRVDRFAAVSARIGDLHSYDLPAITVAAVGGTAATLDWITESVDSSRPVGDGC